MAGIEAEQKLLKFHKDIKDQKYFNVKLISLFQTEYEEIINDILNLKEELFIDQIKEGVSLVLEDIYTDYVLTEPTVMKLVSENIEEVKNKYKQDFYLVNNAWNSYEKSVKKRLNQSYYFLSSFRKHCINTEENISHNCLSKEKDGEKNCRFIVVYSSDSKRDIKFVICENCKKVYYSSFILARCYKCKVDYYTSLLYPEENPEILLATWENYHCPQLINEKMKCINCHEYFYLNMKTGLLNCLNKKCGFISKPNRILWTCCTCKKEFKSGAIPYNPLDIQVTKKLISQTLSLKHKAHPKKMVCGCKLNIYFTDFYHNKNCEGILYESELDDNTIIVCEKCKMITYIDRFIWTCPKCEKKFKNGLGDNNNYLINPNENLYENENSEEIHVYAIRDSTNSYNSKAEVKTTSTQEPKHLNYASKRLKNYKLKQENKKKLFQEKKNEEEKPEIKEQEKEENREENKEKEEVKEKKVISGGWKHRRYNQNHPKSSQEVNNYEDSEEKNINNIRNINKEEEKPEGKKIFRRYGYKDKDRDNLNKKNEVDLVDIDKNKENKLGERQKEKENNTEDKGQQRYVSPRNMWKKRFFRFNNSNNKEFNLSDKENKEEKEDKEEKEEKEEKINIKEKKVKTNPNSKVISNHKNSEQENEPEQNNNINNNNSKENINKPNKNSNNNNNNNESKEESINFEEDEENLSNSVSGKDLELSEEDEEESSEKNVNLSPKFKRINLIKKKTIGVILGETEDSTSLESPRKHKKKNAPQIQVKIAMSKIPGVSEHLFNHINKRMTAILNRCKIPVFNIEDYVFNKKLGEGGYAVIFSVFKKDDEEQKQFALKKIIAKTLTEIDKFTKEFEIMHNCLHENIMKIYGICIRILDQTTYALYVLMELSERDWDKDIKNHIAKKKYYSEKKLINILRQLTSALLFMQKTAKISHRDIKPQNVLLFNGTYKIADFGEAKMANVNSEINTLRGTELFMSPVLYSGLKHDKNDVNHDPYKSDVFSLGFCFLYASTLNFELLYKVRDIYNSNMMNQILEQNLKNKYSKTFIYILSKMLDTDEYERFNFEQLVEFVEDKYDKEGNLKEGGDNINNINEDKGKNSPVSNRKKFKK